MFGYILVLVYALSLFKTMHEMSDKQFELRVDYGEGIPMSMDGYGKDVDLQIAFGVSDMWTRDATYDDYADYGSLKLYYEYWDDDKSNNVLTPISYRPCTL